MRLSTIISAVALSITVNAGAINNLPFPMQNITWIGALEKGGPNVTLTGHGDHVAEQLHKLKPWWHRKGANLTEVIPESDRHAHAAMEKRGRVSVENPLFITRSTPESIC